MLLLLQIYLYFGFMAIINASLELCRWNLEQR